MTETRVAMITGCGKPDGAGQGIARRLADDGFAIVATDRAPAGVPNAGQVVATAESGLDRLVADLRAGGTEAVAVLGDIGERDDVERMFAEVDAAFGRLDVLVNNAAMPQGPDRADVAEVPLEAWDESLRINLTGTFLMCRAAIARMRERRYGRIVNISSMAGITPAARSAAYSATKAGVLGLTRALAMDVAAWGITVNAIAPGLVGTSRSMLGRSEQDREQVLAQWADRIAVGRVGMPEDVGNAVSFFADERTSHVTAQVLQLDGGGSNTFGGSKPPEKQ
ncbi:beta-ketoacyl-ACP reductase [Pseudoclavibacter endophyticus]|uniref:SDR family oxidoreductase n=1 Tax=Pseudoclavibacter endophyticus TaxID=1778590 RepID=A0A6H9WM80_9MICO|nr:SDR family NAD(P)-dependent oxidoreductase [Pseudoclavibacter endophyticus]KAB1650263.1 SDR family oxidoreductase [Pseudoclavibacter endophyticus]GGA55694.1 beta-ketoacyl-ACP reductase [Pseudoclavibacter endophyticus]